MREFLSKMVGKRIDVYCGGASSLSGKLLKIEGGVLHMKDEDGQMCYVAVDHVVVVWEARDNEQPRPGFVSHPK